MSSRTETPQEQTELERRKYALLEKVAALRPLIRGLGPRKAAAVTELIVLLLLADLDEQDRNLVVRTLSEIWQRTFNL